MRSSTASPGAALQKLVTRAAVEAPERLVVDPVEFGPTHAIDYSTPSPDGRFVASGVSPGGSEHAAVYLRDVASGRDFSRLIADVCSTWKRQFNARNDCNLLVSIDSPTPPGSPILNCSAPGPKSLEPAPVLGSSRSGVPATAESRFNGSGPYRGSPDGGAGHFQTLILSRSGGGVHRQARGLPVAAGRLGGRPDAVPELVTDGVAPARCGWRTAEDWSPGSSDRFPKCSAAPVLTSSVPPPWSHAAAGPRRRGRTASTRVRAGCRRRRCSRRGASTCAHGVDSRIEYAASHEGVSVPLSPVATCYVRGGCEYDEAWYEGGRKVTKSNSRQELLGCGEHLVATGVSTMAQLGIMGSSAGGITVGPTFVERNELFAAAAPRVGVLDAVRASGLT